MRQTCKLCYFVKLMRIIDMAKTKLTILSLLPKKFGTFSKACSVLMAALIGWTAQLSRVNCRFNPDSPLNLIIIFATPLIVTTRYFGSHQQRCWLTHVWCFNQLNVVWRICGALIALDNKRIEIAEHFQNCPKDKLVCKSRSGRVCKLHWSSDMSISIFV